METTTIFERPKVTIDMKEYDELKEKKQPSHFFAGVGLVMIILALVPCLIGGSLYGWRNYGPYVTTNEHIFRAISYTMMGSGGLVVICWMIYFAINYKQYKHD